MSDRPLPPELAATYQVEGVLGEGAFGVVFRATHRARGTAVALKLLHESLDDPETRRRFEREARATASLEHPHIVRVLDSGVTSEDEAWIAYEYVPGEPLGRMPEVPLLVNLGAALADALQVVHDAGLVHRDVKPENILVRPHGAPVLCDLGVARSTREGTVATATGILLGTPAYMAPELWWGVAAGPASDQWALAATLYESWSGHPVYAGEQISEIREAAMAATVPQIPPGPTGRPPPFAAALERALRSKPEERFASCRAFAAALREPARPGTPSGPSPAAVTLLGPPSTPPEATLAGGARAPEAPDAEAPAPSGRLLRGSAWALGAMVCLALGFLWKPAPPPATPPAPPASPPPPSIPEAVRAARDELAQALAELHRVLPPEPDGSPEFLGPKSLKRYLDADEDGSGLSRARQILDPEFLPQWAHTGDCLARWLRALRDWQQRTEDGIPLLDRPGVREDFVALALRGVRSAWGHIWVMRFPLYLDLDSVPTMERNLKIHSPESFHPYAQPLFLVEKLLEEEVFATAPLARALAPMLWPTDWAPRMDGGLTQLLAALGPAPLDPDRAWVLLSALRLGTTDMRPPPERCDRYSDLIRRADTLLRAPPALGPGAPTVTELHASLAGLILLLPRKFRCQDDWLTPENADILDRHLAWLRAHGVLEGPAAIREWSSQLLAEEQLLQPAASQAQVQRDGQIRDIQAAAAARLELEVRGDRP